MANEANESFDLDKLQQLVEMMEKHDLREVKLSKGGQKWILRRGAQEVVQVPTAMNMMPPAPMPAAPAPAPAAPAAESGEAAAADSGLIEIVSPTVGTFYSSPQPGDPPFVKVGDKVRSDTIVCIVEAMKVFNQIPAEVSGTITKVLASDGDPVDFGQALFLVKPE
ncbi:Acetyl-CoA biotin carboxyl carrier [Maioricimonas rarisocia]|uniref:Biotin carboxyl carrier protein of acetyl-CoA carboxylase n=1 Tax=Maioricimonas rarisocia TaxID=2528026 RepID=A0A517Z7Y0_9PLAN|nr:acetyl-CoA carboxylase biotin carboxyl carrier protein [Maioricimonas rarisocia]QDU38549.1 Acetyl-CoA biotin carboxyl carrier [Maioricimonas rarisocia]